MANLIKAFVLFVFGFVIVARVGDALDKKGKSAKAARSAPSAAAGMMGTAAATHVVEEPETGLAEQPLPETKAVVRDGTYAEVCASFDPIARPEEIIDILEYASETTGTPVDVLFAVWQKETGYLHGDGRMSGGCDLKTELERRDGDAGTDHWNAMLAMAEPFGWKQRYGNNLERMTCSCPKYRVKGQYGGCCGPFQFSGNEIAHQYAIPRNLDPMTFCGGALIAGWELKKHYATAFKPHKCWPQGRANAILAANARHPVRKDYPREWAVWQAAMSRYYGCDDELVYGNTAMGKIEKFITWRKQEENDPGYLVRKILDLPNTKYSLRKLRKSTTFAFNP